MDVLIIIVAPAGGIVVAVLSWLLVRVVHQNDEAHKAMQSDIGELKDDTTELKVGQARMESKLDLLVEDRKNG